MNKQTEALKMAIEALAKHATDESDEGWQYIEAIQACKEALEQPASKNIRDSFNEMLEDKVAYYKGKQPAQEPVAWMMVNREPETGAAYLTFEKPTRVQKISHHPHELYTHPTPSWQGLSEEEFIYFTHWVNADVLVEIEQALKGKNNV